MSGIRATDETIRETIDKPSDDASMDKSLSLAGKVALVTGGSRGIGKAIAARLAQLGAAIAICGRDSKTLEVSAKELQQSGARVHLQKTDVTKSSELATVANVTEGALAGLPTPVKTP